jgi:hypothetical protein
MTHKNMPTYRHWPMASYSYWDKYNASLGQEGIWITLDFSVPLMPKSWSIHQWTHWHFHTSGALSWIHMSLEMHCLHLLLGWTANISHILSFRLLDNHDNKDSYDSLTLPHPPLFMYGSCLVATFKFILLSDPVISPLKLLLTLHSPAFTRAF